MHALQRTSGNEPHVSNDGAALRPGDVLIAQPRIDRNEVEREWPACADEPLISVINEAVECELVLFPQLNLGFFDLVGREAKQREF